MYMHLYGLQEILRPGGPFRQKGYNLLHILPTGFAELVPKSRFRAVPVRLRLCELPLARRSQFKDVLPLVGSLRGADPAALLHSVQGPRQCRTVHSEAAALSLLGRPTGYG